MSKNPTSKNPEKNDKKESKETTRLYCDKPCPKCNFTKGGVCKDKDGHMGPHVCNKCGHQWS